MQDYDVDEPTPCEPNADFAKVQAEDVQTDVGFHLRLYNCCKIRINVTNN